MAETKDFRPQSTQPNQTMQHEKAKAEVSGQHRQDEQSKTDKERQEKGAIGGQPSTQTGEPGRARNELDQNKKQNEPTSQR